MIEEQRYPLPAVLDMGNGTIRVLVADALADGSFSVVGVGEEASAGLDEGRIVDLGKATAALERAIRTAELDSDRKIKQVVAAVSGEYIKSYANEGKVVIGADITPPAENIEPVYQVAGGVVGKRELYKVLEMGVAAVSDGDMEVLDVVEKNYSIDKQHNIRNPLGMKGKLLTGNIHLIVAERQNLENIEKCINQTGMTLSGRVVFSGLAAARAVLSEEEKRLGVCLLDIGAQTSEVTVFCNGGVYETNVCLEAANLIHTDISAVHHTTLASAEKCKKQVGVNMPTNHDEMLELCSTSGEVMKINHSILLRTVTSRVDALVEHVNDILRRVEKKEGRKLTAGVVLTGGGAMLPGLIEMVVSRLQVPVRIGLPAYNGDKSDRLKNPQYATVIGLMMMAHDKAGADRTQPFGQRLKNFFFNSLPTKEKTHGYETH